MVCFPGAQSMQKNFKKSAQTFPKALSRRNGFAIFAMSVLLTNKRE
jgi:hypothetical protein